MKILPAYAATALVLAWSSSPAMPQTQATQKSDAVPLPAGARLPEWPKPTLVEMRGEAPVLKSGGLELVHSRDTFGGFVVRVSGQPVAIGQNRPMVAYVTENRLMWIDLAHAAARRFWVQGTDASLESNFECTDASGARWKLVQTFRQGRIPETIDVKSSVTVNQDRAVAFLPMFMAFPGAASFGQDKGQGLLAGLEYLENEPSSSEADVIGPAAKRQVPDSLKLTFPLMVIQSRGSYLALSWQMRQQFCAIYDSPDRLFGSGGHAMGLLFPGSNGEDRQEGSLLPRRAQVLPAGAVLTLNATLLGGRGQSVVPAVQQYVRLRPLPPIPSTLSLTDYVTQASGGWLDSKIRENGLVRHAILGGNFPPGQAADAAMWIDWLAERNNDLRARLRQTASNVLGAVTSPDLNIAGVGHVRYPVAALIYGHVEENAVQAAERARRLLAGFEPDGSLKYHPRTGGPDYGKTHYTNEANGLTSRSVLDCLEAAAFCGDRALLSAALDKLRAMDRFRGGVPRGAQTWECPLHTPDILASAQMVRAYTLGYELTGDAALLDQARYWAWTGVPFVYLVSPTAHPVGLYSTIAVFGATQWQAPVWMGLPVQWCGLVYADSLYRLVRHDPTGPWKRLADGVTASGIQQSWQAMATDTQGLLPDSFVLRTQHRNGPAINPATVQACAVHFFGQTPVYDFWACRSNNLRVHAPGEISNTREQPGRVSFEVIPAFNRPCFVLVNGLMKEPQLTLNGKPMPCSAPNEFRADEGRLVLRIEGKTRVELSVAQ